MIKLGKLTYIDNLRSVWKHEASDFTPWLAEEENIDLLSDALGIDLVVEQTESPVGNYSLDILATIRETENKVVIENELEDTDHRHLGQLLTYASGKDAKVVVWVVKKAREEHRNAIEWLNNHTDYDISFFLVEVKLISIDGSEPAVVFDVVEKPNDWQKETKKIDVEMNDAKRFKLDYWTNFVEYASGNAEYKKLFVKNKPMAEHWYPVSMGSSEYHMSFGIKTAAERTFIEIYIKDNKELFRTFFSYKQEIEKELGVQLNWLELPRKKASRIVLECPAQVKDKAHWQEQFEWFVQMGNKFYKTFKKYA